MRKLFKHLHKVNKHRFMVFKLCCKCGLFFRGLLHDLSKYSFAELYESVKYFTDGKGSPLSRARQEKGYSSAWLHHKGRNKHHMEYWNDEHNKLPSIMPYKYAVESVCDKIASTKNYRGKDYVDQHVLDYWNNEKDKICKNEKMREFFQTVLEDLVQYGQKHILNKRYMKEKYNTIVLDK